MVAKIELELDWVGARCDLFHLLGTNASVTLWTQREASKKSWTRQHREATVKGPELPNDDINRHEPVLVGALVLHCRVCVAVADSRGSLIWCNRATPDWELWNSLVHRIMSHYWNLLTCLNIRKVSLLFFLFIYNQAKMLPGDKVLNHLSNAVNLSYNYITFIWFLSPSLLVLKS